MTNIGSTDDGTEQVTAKDVIAYAEERGAAYEARRAAEHAEWEWRRARNIKRVNRRFTVLYVALVLGVGYLAYRGEVADTRIRDGLYQACTERAAQIVAYNNSGGRQLLVDIVVAANPSMTAAQRDELVAALAVKLQLPAPQCVRT
jgi:hypothetical protein